MIRKDAKISAKDLLLLAALGEAMGIILLLFFSSDLRWYHLLGWLSFHGAMVFLFDLGLQKISFLPKIYRAFFLVCAFFMPFSLPFLYYYVKEFLLLLTDRTHSLQGFAKYIEFRPTPKLPRFTKEMILQEMELEPLQKVLYTQDSLKGQWMIKELGKLKTARSYSLLRQCLNHPLPELRLYAFYELDHESRRFFQKIQEVVEEVETHSQYPEIWMEVGETFFQAVQIQLFDQELSRVYIDLAVRAFQKGYSLAPKEVEFPLSLGNLFLLLKDYGKEKLQESLMKVPEENLSLQQKEVYDWILNV